MKKRFITLPASKKQYLNHYYKMFQALKMVVDDIETNSGLTTETAAHVTKLYYSLKD